METLEDIGLRDLLISALLYGVFHFSQYRNLCLLLTMNFQSQKFRFWTRGRLELRSIAVGCLQCIILY